MVRVEDIDRLYYERLQVLSQELLVSSQGRYLI